MQQAFHLFIGLLSLIVWPCVGMIILSALLHYNDPNDILNYHPYIMWGIMVFTILFAIMTYVLVRVQDLEITFTEYFNDIGRTALIAYTLALTLVLGVAFGFANWKANCLDALAEMKAVQYKLEYVNTLGSITYVADVLVGTPDSILFIQTKYDNRLDSVTSETH